MRGVELTVHPPGEVRQGATFGVAVDLELPSPWFAAPAWGRKLSERGGELLFETPREEAVAAPIAGRVTVTDTRLDVHTPAGFPDGGAGRGVEAVLHAPGGGLTLQFWHLARGARAGQVRPGEVFARSGNTGRCPDGCGRTFVGFAVGGRRRLEELVEPLRLEVSWDGRLAGRPFEVPAGEATLRRREVGRVKAVRAVGRAEGRLRVALLQGRRGRELTAAEVAVPVKL